MYEKSCARGVKLVLAAPVETVLIGAEIVDYGTTAPCVY